MSTTIQQIRKLPEAQKTVILAIGIVLNRLLTLSNDDRDDLFQFFKLYADADSEDDRNAADEGIWELLLQEQVGVRKLDLSEEEKPDEEFGKWKTYVGTRVSEARKVATLTQDELSSKAGLPQSHISRIERGKLSPSAATLEKIAKALDISPSSLDPSL